MSKCICTMRMGGLAAFSDSEALGSESSGSEYGTIVEMRSHE